MNLKKVLRFTAAFVAIGLAMPALAGTISYTCDPNVTSSTCNYLNTTIAGQYNSTFTDASASIYVEYGTTGLASTAQSYDDVSYASYVAALTANAGKDAIQTAAIAALTTYDTAAYGGGDVEITDALATALGFTGLTGITAGGATCSLNSAGCYNGVVVVTNDPTTPLYYDNQGGTEASDAFDFYGAVEHQTDEVLGTASCISTGPSLADTCHFANEPSAADLFRYSAPGSLVLDSSLSTTPGAYFSYNGGATNGATGVGGGPKFYNTLANGEAYGDFVPSSPNCATNQAIQDAVGCSGKDAGLSILNDGGGEINMLNAVGYDLKNNVTVTATPEPSSLLLLGTGLLGLSAAVKRRLTA